jgi:hypothetical protein
MATVRVEVQMQKQPLPVGVTGQGNLRYRITRIVDDSLLIEHQDPGTPLNFPEVPPGDYRVTVQRLSNTGEDLGPSAFADFSVLATDFDAVVSVTAMVVPGP